MAMTKSERDELRRLVRQRFKVLRAEVQARQAELESELRERIAAKFAEADKMWNDAIFLIEEAARAANRKANDILRALPSADELGYDPTREYTIVSARAIARPVRERVALQQRGAAAVEAQVRTALVQLERQENDLLTQLALGALESAEAQAFLNRIPTVGELVPAGRLLALEQMMTEPNA